MVEGSLRGGGQLAGTRALRSSAKRTEFCNSASIRGNVPAISSSRSVSLINGVLFNSCIPGGDFRYCGPVLVFTAVGNCREIVVANQAGERQGNVQIFPRLQRQGNVFETELQPK